MAAGKADKPTAAPEQKRKECLQANGAQSCVRQVCSVLFFVSGVVCFALTISCALVRSSVSVVKCNYA